MVKKIFYTQVGVWVWVMLLLVSCAGGQSSVPVEPTAVSTAAASVPPLQTAVATVTAVSASPTSVLRATPDNATPDLTPSVDATQPAAQPVAAATAVPLVVPDDAIVVDHTAVDMFERIPEEYLQAAANLRMIFIDRSVGANISDGLSCLAFPSDEDAPNHCRRYEHINLAFSSDPQTVNWSRAGGYIRDNWAYTFWPEGDCNEWYGKVDCFIELTTPIIDQYDVLSFQLSYLAVTEDSNILDPSEGFFVNNDDRADVFDLAAYEAAHPDKVFIYWTTSLSRQIGTAVSQDFNQQMRQYALANNKPLFDVADILAHDPNGNPCYDNRDGILYDNGNRSENHPDDGQDFLAICPHYTTEIDGGHLGSVSIGKIRLAKAFWVLMARIAGWDGN